MYLNMKRFPITKEGYRKLQDELKHLKEVDRPAIISEISKAREFGDLSENAEYHAAKEKQNFIELRINELEMNLLCADIIDISHVSSKNIQFGATVTIQDLDNENIVRYKIVGDYEADLKEHKVSISSPLARALIGRQQNEEIEFTTPGGIKAYKIIEVTYA